MYRLRALIQAGIAAALLLFMIAAETRAQFGIGPQQVQQKPDRKVLSSPTGRYVFGQISDSTKDQFMLDTQTGRLWRISESSEVGIFLSPVPYKSGDGKYPFLPGAEPEWKAKGPEKK